MWVIPPWKVQRPRERNQDRSDLSQVPVLPFRALLEDAHAPGSHQQPDDDDPTPARTLPWNKAMIPRITRIHRETHSNVAAPPVIAKKSQHARSSF